jgi:hypothetical protein
VTGALTRQAPPRDAMKLALDLGNQLLQGLLVALAPRQKESGDALGSRHGTSHSIEFRADFSAFGSTTSSP